MWNPLDPYSLIQFLTHPVCPIPKRVRRRLAEAVTDAPGIGRQTMAECHRKDNGI